MDGHVRQCGKFLRQIAGCAALVIGLPCPPAAAGEPAVRQDCHRDARLTTEVRLTAGVATEQAIAAQPLTVEIPAGYDSGLYQDCLQRAGIAPDVAKSAYVQREPHCREHARVVAAQRVRIADATAPRITGGFDQAAYAACLDGTTEVEVDIPAR